MKETDDPSSDVLANLLDLDPDGRSDYLLKGYIDGSTPSRERRVFGFFRELATFECQAAAESCRQPSAGAPPAR